MTNLEQFFEDMRQFLKLGQEKRIIYGKTFTDKYYNQVESIGVSKLEARGMLERLVAYMSASDGEINRSEYEFCNACLFTIEADTFLKTCRKYILPNETKILRDFAHKNYEAFGHKSYFYIIAIFIIAANNNIDVSEQKKLCNIFGIK